ncbi:kinase-like domain-containing protein [Gigaspora rosea]|uniref:Kinase-like domain-containing protein n=1 Tax=Gigaspora rosea TaxID=44941 RepID=A0A397V5S4_9GLOM|nr:kinase-like domain-containing protein [Gigaspora rosea]
MEWKDKLNLLICIAADLQAIHSQKLIHRDLHSGNILQDSLNSAYIADLGLLISVKMASKMVLEKQICGILPYIAPEILEGSQYTTESDIYSFGIIIWEIFYGVPVFVDQDFGPQFQLQIVNGLRPTILEGTPECSANLIARCWDKKPQNRPSAKEIHETFINWKNDERNLVELSKIKIINLAHIQAYSEENYRSRFSHTVSYYQGNQYKPYFDKISSY